MSLSTCRFTYVLGVPCTVQTVYSTGYLEINRQEQLAPGALPAARPVTALAAVRCEPARVPPKANLVRLVTHHALPSLELSTSKDEPFELLRRNFGYLRSKSAF